jgi:chromosome segregation ATPase
MHPHNKNPHHPTDHHHTHRDVVVRDQRAVQDRTPLFILGTLIALMLVGGIFWLATPDDNRDDRLGREEIRIESETNIESPRSDGYDVERYSLEVRDLRTNTDSLLARATVANRAEIEQYRDRVKTLESRLQDSRNDAAAQRELESELASLRNDYEALEARAQTASADAVEAQADASEAQAQASDAQERANTVAFTQKAETRLEKMEDELESVDNQQKNGELAMEIDALTREIDTLDDQIENMDSDEVLSPAAMTQMEETLAALESRVQTLNTSVSMVSEENI